MLLFVITRKVSVIEYNMYFNKFQTNRNIMIVCRLDASKV